MKRNNAWKSYSKEEEKKVNQLAQEYCTFLDKGKTERECVKEIISQAEAAGYVNLEQYRQNDKKIQPGDKIYAVCMKKTIALFQIGTDAIEKGMNILGAHIDSPRLDIKQNPLFEEEEFAYLDTHYYGGIKKYQWVTLPLALHGVVVKKDGEVINVVIGEKDTDPVFGITDLLIHLSQQQLEKKANKVIEGEDLNILIGSRPIEGEEKETVKANVLAI